MELTLDILEWLDREPDLNVTDVAQRLDVDKSTASRRLSMLVKRGFVDRDAVTGRFCLGVKFIGLGQRVAKRLSIRSVAYPILVKLRDEINESVELSLRRGMERVYIEVVETTQALRRVLPLGVPIPLYPGSPGKVFMAYMTAEELAPILDNLGDTRFATGAVPDRASLEAELRVVCETGVATAYEEMFLGMGGMAFPVFDRNGEVAAVLGLAVPEVRLTPERKQRCIEQGLAAAREVSARLGFRESALSAGRLRPEVRIR